MPNNYNRQYQIYDVAFSRKLLTGKSHWLIFQKSSIMEAQLGSKNTPMNFALCLDILGHRISLERKVKRNLGTSKGRP